MTKIECSAKHVITEDDSEEKITTIWKNITVSFGNDDNDFAYITIGEKVKDTLDEPELRLNAEEARIRAILLTNAADKVEK